MALASPRLNLDTDCGPLLETNASSAPHRFESIDYLVYVVLCLIWGTTWMAIRVLVRDVSPLWAAGVRFVLAALLLAVTLALRRTAPIRGARQWRATLILGFTIVAIPYGLLFWAEQYITSSMAAVMYTSVPLAVSLFTPLMTHDRVPRAAIFCMVVAMGGIGVLFSGALAVSRNSLLGGVAMLGAVASTSWSIVFAKRELHDIDHWAATAWQTIFGGAVLLALGGVLERGRPATWTPAALAALLFLAIVGTAVAFALYYWLLKRVRPYQAASMSLVIPVIAIFEGALILGEAIPASMIAASVLVLLSVAVLLRVQSVGIETFKLTGDWK
ncbi:MAG: DMT family transporter [Terriglobales bacterium]